MSMRSLLAAVFLMQLVVPSLEARIFQRQRSRLRSGNIALRRRVNINSLITEPGTVELEWNSTWNPNDNFAMPSTIKWTPEGRHILWGRTEFSASFDAMTSSPIDGRWITHSSDHLTLSGTSLLCDGERWDFAFAPLVTFEFRGDQSTRAGAAAILRHDAGRSSMGATLVWTTRTAADSSPAGILDAGFGYGRAVHRKATLHMNGQYEFASGSAEVWNVSEGVEFHLCERVDLDVTAMHVGAVGAPLDHQVLIGMTVSLGRPGRWFRASRTGSRDFTQSTQNHVRGYSRMLP